MAFNLLSANALEWTEGDIILSVTTGGSDTASRNRPNKLLKGDYTALPFASLGAALATLPRGLRHNVLIRVGAGTFDGLSVFGFVGRGSLRVAGTKVLATPTTGINTGNATGGTTSTTLNRTGANWTVNDLRGKFIVITAGAAVSGDDDFPMIRMIKSNTSSSVTFESIMDLEAGDTFQICDVGTLLETADESPYGQDASLLFTQTQARIECTLLRPNVTANLWSAYVYNCSDVAMSGMHFTSGTVRFLDSMKVTVQSALVDTIFNPYSCGTVFADDLLLTEDGTIDAQFITNHRIKADAIGCIGTAMKIRDCVSVLGGLKAVDCQQTPLDLQNIHNFQINGLLTGDNPDVERGALFSRGGQYNIAGADIAGSESDEFEIEGRAGSYYELSGVNSGTYMARGTFLHWGTGYTVLQTKLRVEGGESGDDFDEFIVNNGVIGGTVKHYGAWQSLDPAYKQIASYVDGGGGGNTQENATVIGFRDTLVVSQTADFPNGSVRLLSSGEIAYAGGLIGSVNNGSNYAIRLFPPEGQQIYLGGWDAQGEDQYISVPIGAHVVWLARHDLDYSVWVLTPSGSSVTSSTSEPSDNALAKYDGTSGTIIKAGGIIADDGDQLHGYRAKRKVITDLEYTLLAEDTGCILEFNVEAECLVTTPNDLGADFCATIVQTGFGQPVVIGSAGSPNVIVVNIDSQYGTAGQYAMCTLYRTEDSGGDQQFIFAGRTG